MKLDKILLELEMIEAELDDATNSLPEYGANSDSRVSIDIAKDFLDEDGFFLGKCFKGGAEASVLETLNKSFKVVKHVKPDASRKESVESYVLAMLYKNKT